MSIRANLLDVCVPYDPASGKCDPSDAHIDGSYVLDPAKGRCDCKCSIDTTVQNSLPTLQLAPEGVRHAASQISLSHRRGRMCAVTLVKRDGFSKMALAFRYATGEASFRMEVLLSMVLVKVSFDPGHCSRYSAETRT